MADHIDDLVTQLFVADAVGDEKAWSAADDELSGLAIAGHDKAVRVTLNILQAQWSQQVLSDLEYTDRAIPVARIAVSIGQPSARSHLAGLLHVRGLSLAKAGDAVGADDCQAEALALLDTLADEGDEDSAAFLGVVANEVSPAAIEIACIHRKAAAKAAPVPAPPPIVIPFNPAPVPFSRDDRLRWWLDDRLWDLRLAWWRFTDWVREY